jgi:hypothetical protein
VKKEIINKKFSERFDKFVRLNLIDIKKSDISKRKSKSILNTVRA